jgi:nucleotide-binding universal stress UspA family protein
MNGLTRGGVVVGLDRSERGRVALEYAASLSSRRQLPLRLVHVVEPPIYGVIRRVGWTSDVEGIVRRSAQHLIDDTIEVLGVVHPDLEISAFLTIGDPIKTLIEQSTSADTVVLGSRGAGGFADLVVGSTALHVAAHASCTVIAVPEPPEPDAPRRGVVVGVDGSDESQAAIGYAFETAAETGEKLTAMLAWHDSTRTGVGAMMPITYDPADVVMQERAVLAESMSGWQRKFPYVEVEQQVVLGHPVPMLVSRSTQARLLVVGCRGRGALRSRALGSGSHGVLHHATGPVAVVHPSR